MGKVQVENHNMVPTFYRLTSLSFHVNRPVHSWGMNFWQFDLKIQCQGHGWKSQHQGSNILSTHIPFVPCQSAIAFLIYDKMWPWKSMIKVMVEVKVENHKVGVTSNRLTPFPSMSIDPSIPEIETFLNSTVKIQSECEMTMVLYTYRSRRFHITSNGINPSSSFRNMASTKYVRSAASFYKLRAMEKHIWGKWANYYDTVNYKSRQVHNTLNGLNPSSGFRDLSPANSGPNFFHILKSFFGPWVNDLG